MRCGSARQRSVHEIFLSTTCSHLVQAPCCPIPTALLDLSSSTTALTSFWTSCLRSFPRALSKRGDAKVPSPALPLATVPTRTLWRSRDSACSTAASALHFLPVLTPAPDTFGSADWRYCSTSLACKTLNSSSMDFKGSVSLQVFPYSAMLVKLLGSPNQRLK